MIIGIGTDIIAIKRIEKLISERFIKRILSPAEQEALSNLPEAKHANFLAKRFSAKEAISKALGTGIGTELSFQDITISHDEKGKPLCHVPKYDNIKIHVSLSDETEYVTTFAVAESL